eukprot:m.749472 g.749472  ORF g.749472 m.749472 type:complete len:109 (+) comp58976_c0_seq9:63-389(+)
MMDYCCGDDSVAALDAELAGLPGLLGELQSTMNLLTDLRGLMAQAEQELIDYETLCFATELRAVKVWAVKPSLVGEKGGHVAPGAPDHFVRILGIPAFTRALLALVSA